MSTDRLVNVFVKSLMVLCLAGNCCLAAASLRPEGPREKRSSALPTRLKYEHANQRMAIMEMGVVSDSRSNGQRGFRGSALPTRIKYEHASNSQMTRGTSSKSSSFSSGSSGCSQKKQGRGNSGRQTRVKNANRKSGNGDKAHQRQAGTHKSGYTLYNGMPVLVP